MQIIPNNFTATTRLRLIPLLLLTALCALNADEPGFRKEHVTGFYVVGLEARTSNELEMRSKGKIGELVARVQKDGLLKKLGNRVGSNTYALYTNYQSDRNGAYTYFFGAKVSSSGSVPRGMVSRQVPSGDYATVTGAGAPAVNVILKLWHRIWDLEDAHRIDRAYKTDFEVHHGIDENNDPGGRVDVFVGVK